jgi:transposase-like protein
MDSKLSLSAKRQLWRERYDEFKQSGLTQAEYCRQHGLPVRALSYWVRKYGNQQAPSRQEWAALTVSDSLESSDNHQLTVQTDKFQLRIPAGFDQKTIACVIGLLKD